MVRTFDRWMIWNIYENAKISCCVHSSGSVLCGHYFGHCKRKSESKPNVTQYYQRRRLFGFVCRMGVSAPSVRKKQRLVVGYYGLVRI